MLDEKDFNIYIFMSSVVNDRSFTFTTYRYP